MPYRFVRAAISTLLAALLVLPHSVAPAMAEDASEPDAFTGAVVVAFDRGARGDVESAAERLGGIVEEAVSDTGLIVVEPPASATAESFAARIEDRDDVRFAEPVQVVRAATSPNDTEFTAQWNVMRVGAPSAWSLTNGTGVTVAVVDSGVDLWHPDLAGQIDTARDRDFIDDDHVAQDMNGHGTHVTGILAAKRNNGFAIAGIADGVRVLPVRVLDEYGAGDTVLLAKGIRYAADNGAAVINLSLGFPWPSHIVEDAVEYAFSKGCLVVAAAGNSGQPGLQYPAAYDDVLSVGSTDLTGSRASFSQYGSSLDIVAPGTTSETEGIVSLRLWSGAGAGTRREFGTSMSTPHVSAAAAMLRSVYPSWTPAIVANRILATAEDIGPVGKDPFTGHGMLRIDRALGVDASAPEPPGDDALPGVPVYGSPIDGIFDAVADPLDVFSVNLRSGQVLRGSIQGSTGAAVSLALHGPGATTLVGATPLFTTVSDGSAVPFEYRVPAGGSGTHRMVVTAVQGGGPYRLTWKRAYETALTIKAPSTCAWAGKATISGVASRAYSGTRLDGTRVVVDAWPSGSTAWKRAVASGETDGAGAYRIKVSPKKRTTYRVRVESSAASYPSKSAKVVVTPKAYLTAPKPSTTVKRGVTFTVAGKLKPKHTAGARSVKITAYRKESGRWVARRTVWAKNASRSGYTRYSGRIRLPYRGSWKLVASIKGDSKHATTRSSAVYVRLR